MARARLRVFGSASALAGLLLACAPVFVVVAHDSVSLGYDPGRDYAYRFAPESVRRLALRVDEDGLTLPASAGEGDTALLELELRGCWSGRLLRPRIDVRVEGERRARFYLERGAAGTRLLDLSHLGAPPGARLELVGHHVAWEEQFADLLVFANPPIADRRILVLAPHPDDAEIAAFGLYSRGDSFVVTITAGEAGHDAYRAHHADATERHRIKGRLRVWDSLAVPLLGGVEPKRTLNLGYFDTTLAAMHASPERPVPSVTLESAELSTFRRYNVSSAIPLPAGEPTWRSLVRDLEEVLRRVRPDVIVAPHPLLDAHPDHQFTTIALLEALAAVDSDAGELALYTNHPPGAPDFPFGPADGFVGPPPWFDAGVVFGRVRSHRLDRDTQLRKLFALEAMHDLRRPPPSLRRDWRETRISFTEALRDLIYARGQGPGSYLRRGPRPNELFFAYGFDDAARLSREFRARSS